MESISKKVHFFSFVDEKFNGITSMMEVKISIRIGSPAKEKRWEMWLSRFSPHSILKFPKFTIKLENNLKTKTSLYIRMSVFVTINIHHWHENPVIIFSHFFDLWIIWGKQFIQEVSCSCGWNPFACMNRGLNENNRISLKKWQFTNNSTTFLFLSDSPFSLII